ncbi:unnamed protein product [Blepharisma stoltei]|uniref:Uncharacterized protein n=1 Tax=Blepharisma stoltei TaxID=1481888 RepID=A0AAU9K790_9CILI|nr:unnamed protein product [Blepharisma stoltei]
MKDFGQINHKEIVELVVIIIGIYISYLYFGVLQEGIYTDPKREKFNQAEFVVFVQCLIGFILSFSCMKFGITFGETPNPKPYIGEKVGMWQQYKYKIVHATVFALSMIFSNISITYVSYPTQALAKSCKILPVMMGGFFVSEVKYEKIQYISVSFITSGILMFNLMKTTSGSADSIIGLFCLFLSLTCDAINGYFTEQVRHRNKPTSLEMMSYCNGWGLLVTGLVVLFFSNLAYETPLFTYLYQYPGILWDIFKFGFMSAIGQMFIFRGVKVLGALTLSIITTTRKFMTVILSIIYYNHSLNGYQWVSLLLVFSGTGMDFYLSLTRKDKKVKQDIERPSKD